MNKKELVEEISKQHCISKPQVRIIITQLLRAIYDNLQEGDEITLRDFGTFHMVTNASRRAYNISTRSVENRPTTRRLRFKPSENFKNLVKDQGETQIPKINESIKIEYCGTVSIDRFLDIFECDKYPTLKTPRLGAKILKPQQLSQKPAIGYTEPLMLEGLRKLCEHNTELRIIENVGIPISGYYRQYVPDFVLYHEKANLYIDIEIDEPYVIESRKPIHYIDGRDLYRDQYIINNGWVVIRYSERQVYKHLEELIQDLESKINWLTYDDVCPTSLSLDKRWTEEEAKRLSEENYREKYLGITTAIKENLIDENDYDELYEDLHQSGAVMSLESRWDNSNDALVNQIDYIVNVLRPKYVRVTLKDSRQFILDGDSFLFHGNSISGICSYRYEGRNQWEVKEIETLEPITSLFSDISWRKKTHRLVCDPTCRPILIDAAFNGVPIWIRYKHQRWNDPEPIEYETFISCLYLSADPPSLNYRPWYKHAFTEILGWEEPGQCFYIDGNRLRQFHIDNCDLLEIKVVNCINDFQNINVYKDSLKELILNPCRYSKKVRYHERVETLLTKRNKFPINDLLFLKLRAHYETIKGNIEEALNLYHSIDYNFRVDYDEFASIWGHSCIKDINSYIKQTENLVDSRDIKEISPKDLRQNFSTIKDMLIVKGWSWF